MAESRELIFGYKSTAVFAGKQHQHCRGRTMLCPDRCGHISDTFVFNIDAIAVTRNDQSKNAKFCSPQRVGSSKIFSSEDLGESYLPLAESLEVGETVDLCWNHDYVTRGGSSFPQEPVTALEKKFV